MTIDKFILILREQKNLEALDILTPEQTTHLETLNKNIQKEMKKLEKSRANPVMAPAIEQMLAYVYANV